MLWLQPLLNLRFAEHGLGAPISQIYRQMPDQQACHWTRHREQHMLTVTKES